MARTVVSDPMRNFKFEVIFHGVRNPAGVPLSDNLGSIGFMSVSGLAMSTESIPYREGGYNTSPHKFPGQTDFSPVTMSNGAFRDKYALWYLQKAIYNYQIGQGTYSNPSSPAADDFGFRMDIEIRLLRHPVTLDPVAQAGFGFDARVVEWAAYLYNAWPTSLAYSDLNAGDNSVLVQQVTFVHEGLDIKWGDATAVPFSGAG